MDFIIWCLLFPLVIVYAIDLHYRGFARKILKVALGVFLVGFLLLIAKFVVVKIGWIGILAIIVSIPPLLVIGAVLYSFIRSKIRGEKFW